MVLIFFSFFFFTNGFQRPAGVSRGEGNQLSLWNVHRVPLGIEAGPDLSETTQDFDGGRVQEPSGMDGAGPKMQELSDPPPPKPLK